MDIKETLRLHKLWLEADLDGKRAYLCDVDLRDAELHDVDLRRAELTNVNLSSANLNRADLSGAILTSCEMSFAYCGDTKFVGAFLFGCDCRGTAFNRADFSGADLKGSIFRNACFRDGEFSGTKFPPFQIPQDGDLIVYKKLRTGVVAKLKIPDGVPRTASLIGRKCRAAKAEVIYGEGASLHNPDFTYKQGAIVSPRDPYDPDPTRECTSGIHFFLTREEAEEYDG